mmetsp:Transcript_40334/g.65350  ORF Transcript_40334/g.65350 Transcript_40334/m.65350 type:complete len:254 (+) Transcript_40334:102-863(+)
MREELPPRLFVFLFLFGPTPAASKSEAVFLGVYAVIFFIIQVIFIAVNDHPPPRVLFADPYLLLLYLFHLSMSLPFLGCRQNAILFFLEERFMLMDANNELFFCRDDIPAILSDNGLQDEIVSYGRVSPVVLKNCVFLLDIIVGSKLFSGVMSLGSSLVNRSLKQALLEDLLLIYFRLDSSSNNKPIDIDVPLLSYSIHTKDGLNVYTRIPVCIQHEHPIRANKIDSKTTWGRNQENLEGGGWLVESDRHLVP